MPGEVFDFTLRIMALPVIDPHQMRVWEAASWAAGRSEAAVIQQAGKAVARVAERLTQPEAAILVLAGKGHNGDDARAAGEALVGRTISYLDVVDPELSLSVLESALARKPALVIDGLFGIGLNRPLSLAWQQFIECVNQSGCPVLAVDVPSGLNAATGETYGTAIRSQLTLTMGAPKIGLLTAPAWPYTGKVEVAADIGLIPCPCASETHWLEAGDFTDWPPARGAAGHKGAYGHVLILAGSMGYHGAAVLAARGAMRAMPGLVTVWTAAYAPVAAQLQAAMVFPWSEVRDLPSSISALVAGPGLAADDCPEALRQRVIDLWQHSPLPMVVDASALDWLPAQAEPSTTAPRVLTPHPGEAARLLGQTSAQVQANRPQALRALSRRYGGAWVVLKGHQTLIGRSGSEYWVNPTGNPWMAQGGSGDLLAGLLGGLLAQGAHLGSNLAKAITFGVWRHGLAADCLQARHEPWTIEDLARIL